MLTFLRQAAGGSNEFVGPYGSFKFPREHRNHTFRIHEIMYSVCCVIRDSD